MTEKGKGHRVCKICGQFDPTTEDYVIPAHRYSDVHLYSDWKTTVPATCSENGYEERVCDIPGCQASENRTINPYGHRDPVTHESWMAFDHIERVNCYQYVEVWQCTNPTCCTKVVKDATSPSGYKQVSTYPKASQYTEYRGRWGDVYYTLADAIKAGENYPELFALLAEIEEIKDDLKRELEDAEADANFEYNEVEEAANVAYQNAVDKADDNYDLSKAYYDAALEKKQAAAYQAYYKALMDGVDEEVAYATLSNTLNDLDVAYKDHMTDIENDRKTAKETAEAERRAIIEPAEGIRDGKINQARQDYWDDYRDQVVTRQIYAFNLNRLFLYEEEYANDHNTEHYAHHRYEKEYEVVVPATCCRRGWMERECGECGYRGDSVPIPALEPVYGDKVYTGEDQGINYHFKKCTRTECVVHEKEDPDFLTPEFGKVTLNPNNPNYFTQANNFNRQALVVDHDWGEWKLELAPSEDNRGHWYRTCMIKGCNGRQDFFGSQMEYDEKIGGHTWGEWEFLMTDGKVDKYARTCETCNAVETKEVAHEHVWGEWEVVDVLKDGKLMVRKCQVVGCGAEESKIVPPDPGPKNGLVWEIDEKGVAVCRYYKDDVFQEEFTGILDFDGGKFFVAKGVMCSNDSGLAEFDGVWYFLSNGQIQADYTGLALYDNEWFYLSNGVLDLKKNGLVDYDGSKFLLGAGRIQSEVNGLYLEDDVWYFIGGGQVATSYTGLVEYDGEWFYVEKGILVPYNGEVEYDGGLFEVADGQVVAQIA
jgi:hypothetical protein